MMTLRKVAILKWEKLPGPPTEKGVYGFVDTGEVGLFHQWGSAYEEFESGPGNYTTAIVEMPDRKVLELSPKEIRFLEPPEDHEVRSEKGVQ